jgi:hypothetical protein
VTGFGLANPNLVGEREAAVAMLGGSRPTGRHRARCWWATRALPAERSRPRWPAWSLASWVPLAATNPTRGSFRTGCDSGRGDHLDLKHQLGLDRHGGGIPAGLWARVVQRLLALNTAIWFNWQIGAPTKRSLIAYDHYHPLHQHRKPHQRSRDRRSRLVGRRGRRRRVELVERGRPAGQQVQAVLGGGPGLGAVHHQRQSGVGREVHHLVRQPEVAHDRVMELLAPGAVTAHVVRGPPGAELLAAR